MHAMQCAGHVLSPAGVQVPKELMNVDLRDEEALRKHLQVCWAAGMSAAEGSAAQMQLLQALPKETKGLRATD